MVVTNKKRISLYVREDIKLDLEKLAKVNKRNVSNFIEVMCEEAIEEARRRGIIE